MVILEPTNNKYKIAKPDEDYLSEFEVQAFLYSELKRLGIDVRGEVNFKGEKKYYEQNKKSRQTRCRFDLVIFHNCEAIKIIEVKNAPIKHKTSLENTRQGIRYRHFGIPVIFIYGMNDAIKLLQDEQQSHLDSI